MSKKYFYISIVLALFCVGVGIQARPAHAAISLDSSSTTALTGGAGIFSVTSTITVGTGSNELLLLEVVVNNNGGAPDTVTSTINGVAPSVAYVATTTNDGGVTIEYFYEKGLSAGTYNATTSFNNQGPHGGI